MEESEHLNFTVYPNPARDELWVQAEEGECVLLNGVGQVLMREWVRGKVRWDVSGLPSGMYLLKCAGHVKRIVVGE